MCPKNTKGANEYRCIYTHTPCTSDLKSAKLVVKMHKSNRSKNFHIYKAYEYFSFNMYIYAYLLTFIE